MHTMSTPSITARRGAVTSAFPAASDAGVEMLRAGGNAIDAAVAAAWALCVCEPSGSGLGGQTIALVQLARGPAVVVDGHSRAPAAVSRATVTRAQQQRGHRACTVPTTPATLEHMHRRWGRLPAAHVLEPAIRLAEEGYAITRLQRRQLRWCRVALAATPAAARFLGPGGRPPQLGATFAQPELAAALRRIADAGATDVYDGEIARAIVDDMRRSGGLLDAADLAGCGAPAERAPLAVAHAGFEVLTAPPPGGGRELALALRLLERLEVPADAPGHEWLAALAGVTRLTFAERERRPVRPAEWSAELEERLLGDGRVERLAAAAAAGLPAGGGASAEGAGETTHLCAADDEGGVVSLTQSIQSLFGAKVANPRYGFLYNNYLLTCPRRPHRYRLRGGGPVRSNAAPTLVRAPDGAPRLALGAAGSRRIISAVLHVIAGVVHREADLAAALAQPRIHARLGGAAWLERDGATAELRALLERRGIPVVLKPPHSFCMGAVQAIAFGAGGAMVAAADPRREGEPRGL
jgi:gamma-glutamyltranspeptidase/glutathione hydrolase